MLMRSRRRSSVSKPSIWANSAWKQRKTRCCPFSRSPTSSNRAGWCRQKRKCYSRRAGGASPTWNSIPTWPLSSWIFCARSFSGQGCRIPDSCRKKSGRQDDPGKPGSAKLASQKRRSAVALGSRTKVRLLSQKIGATGFEPATSWSQTRRSTKLSYAPHFLHDGADRRPWQHIP